MGLRFDARQVEHLRVTVRGLPFLLVLALVAAACSRPLEEGSARLAEYETEGHIERTSRTPATANRGSSDVAPSTVPDADSEASGDAVLTAPEILELARPNVVLISTEVATGSGVVLPSGHIVTNSHVVEPYDTVWVSAPDGVVSDAPTDVVGSDIETDIAVLAPVPGLDPPGLRFATGADLVGASDVYLVGYPGEVDFETVEVTIARGLISRTRYSDTFDAEFVQTDAAISGGQSGGALVDERGRLIGISGLGFAGEFALALDGERAQRSVDAVLDGSATGYVSVDERRRSTGAETLTYDDPWEIKRLVFVNGGEARTITVSTDGPATSMLASTFWSGERFANQAALADSSTQLFDTTGAEPRDGDWAFELDPWDELWIDLALLDGITGDLTVAADLGFMILDEGEREEIAVGETRYGTVQPGQPYDVFEIELEAGQSVEIAARTAIGDPGIWVLPVEESWRFDAWVDDSYEGLLDLEPVVDFVAPTTGRYRIAVESVDTYAMAFELTVR